MRLSSSAPAGSWGLGPIRRQRNKKEKQVAREQGAARQGERVVLLSYLFISGSSTGTAALAAGARDTRRRSRLSLHRPREDRISIYRQDPQAAMHSRILDAEAGSGFLPWPEHRRARAGGCCSAGASLGGAEIDCRGRRLLLEIVVRPLARRARASCVGCRCARADSRQRGA